MKSYKRRNFIELICLCLVIALAAVWFSVLKESPKRGPLASYSAPRTKAVSIYDAERAFEGLTLVPESGSGTVKLISMNGSVLHSWRTDADRARLLPSGNLLVVHGSKWGRNREPWRSERDTLREYNWDGDIVWEFKAPDLAHHDVHRLPNGNTLFPIRAEMPLESLNRIVDQSLRTGGLRSDAILEVNQKGEIVWSWYAYDHLDVNSCGERGCDYLISSGKPNKRIEDWTHINTAAPLPENKWYDQGDERFKPGNLVVMPRNWWTVLIVDRESKEVVWQYRGDYKGGLGGGHEPHMIEKGLPGAGNILIFDNGSDVHHKRSFILEINPQTKKVEWVYDKGREFYSVTRGSAQRLPNGNTLISEDRSGRVFEVTPEQETVWQYQSADPTSRAHRYAYDYCEQCKRVSKLIGKE